MGVGTFSRFGKRARNGLASSWGGGRVFRRQAAECGQMTVELVVAFPVMLVVAVIAVNAMTFFSECAAFDAAFRDAVRVCATSPGYGEGADRACALIKGQLEGAFDAENESVSVTVEAVAGGYRRFTGTIEFRATLFGHGLRTSVFGVQLPALSHRASLVVDFYKPGVVL
ncbi:hypothetical protein [Xiamenia xianingshaonis]|uniref:hypothetical protein n=1 Tax=Xiamenia xianingshaonis TaxID=2682776 RepID=UPI0021BDAAA2|nr:hypothetical protein [Xiamenia xianingshaonis]